MQPPPLQDSLLGERDLVEIERLHAGGITSAQILHIFQTRGVRLSEATFRKYIQLGLLPRSRRVGAKGKHRGSRGVYPCATVRRINDIKALMAQSYTIEQIQSSLGAFKQRIDAVESALDELFQSFERTITQPRFDLTYRRNLTRDVHSARQSANALLRQIMQIEGQMCKADKPQRVAGEGVLTDF